MMRNFLFILFLFWIGMPLRAQIQGENKQDWMEDEESQDYRTKLKTSDIEAVVLKNGKVFTQEKEKLSIKMGRNVRLTWTETGKPGEGVLDREDLMACELIEIDASKSTVSFTLYNGTKKTLSHVKFVQELPKSLGKSAKPSEFEVFRNHENSKDIERDLYRFWDFKEIRGKESKGDKTKKVSFEIKNPEEVKKEETPDRSWLENEKSKIFASKVSTSDFVKMKTSGGDWIEAKRGDLGIKVVDDFKLEGKEKGTRKDKSYTKKSFVKLRAVEKINELERTLTVVSSSGQKTDLIEVAIKNAKIEYYWVDDRIKQVRREFVRFWKLREIEVNEPPKPKKPKTKKKKNSDGKEPTLDDEQKDLAKRIERTQVLKITLENGETYEAKAGELAIYFDEDFEIQGLEDEKERKRSVASVRGLKSIEEINEKEHSFVTVTPKGTKKTMTQVQITEQEIEIIEKEGKKFNSFVVSFWDLKEMIISSEEDEK